MRMVISILAVCLLATVVSSRTLQITQAVLYAPGVMRSCQSACQQPMTPLVLGSAFSKQPASYSCRINLDNGEVAPGFQQGTSTCTALYVGKPVTSQNYDCACLREGYLSGLDSQVDNQCRDSCRTSLDGSPGAALADGVGHICLARSEMGNSNHFGTTQSGNCNFVPGGGTNSTAQTSTSQFSCVCSFAQANSVSNKTAG